jgi:hypothetical protein
MKPFRLVLSLVGLAAISLAYITYNLYFLVIAIAAFIVGLFFMGAIGQRSASSKVPTKSKQTAEKKTRKEER